MAVPELSLTEQRVVLLVAAGRSTREIATAIGLDEQTVDWHLARARRKLERVSALQRRVDGELNTRQRRPSKKTRSEAAGAASLDSPKSPATMRPGSYSSLYVDNEEGV